MLNDPILYITDDTALKSISDAIRVKREDEEGTTYSYPAGFVRAIQEIQTGANIIVSGEKIYGDIPVKDAATYYPSSDNQTIDAGQYLAGDQTIKAVTTSGISVENIKMGVTVKVGDTADDDRITSATGTFTEDADAAQGDILSGKIAYVRGEKVTGNIVSQIAKTWTPNTSDQIIPAKTYCSGVQTIKGDANLDAGNIKSGKSIFGVAGSYTGIGERVLHFKTPTGGWYVNGETVHFEGTVTPPGSAPSSGSANVWFGSTSYGLMVWLT